MKKLFSLTFIIAILSLSANNITVTNLTLVDQDITAGANNDENFIKVQFDLSWENSWRAGAPTHNWDAAWVFVKYRVGTSEWHHAFLNNTGHFVPTGHTIDLGLRTPSSAYDDVSNPGIGAFIYRSAEGIGNVSLENVQLQWNYRRNFALQVFDNADIDIRVYAIEMVYVPLGRFWLGREGSSNEVGAFKSGGVNEPYNILSEAAITIHSNPTPTFLWGYSTTGTSTIGPLGTLPAAFPKGYAAYYSMKYEITQQQYVDFLNSLNRTQQNTRISSSILETASSAGTSVRYVMVGPSGASVPTARNGIRCPNTFTANVPIEFYCDLNGNGIGGDADDGKELACNYLSSNDILAYMDWSGLRPMTELEYEKACRGGGTDSEDGPYPIVNEYPWGNHNINSDAYTLDNSGEIDEIIASGYNLAFGNTNIGASGIDGPVRVGIFAVDNLSFRIHSGAAFYAIMEMAGNVQEAVVTVGTSAGRLFEGNHGDGYLNATGNQDEASWSSGIMGARGGAVILTPTTNGRISDRTSASSSPSSRLNYTGGRGARIAP